MITNKKIVEPTVLMLKKTLNYKRIDKLPIGRRRMMNT